MAHFAVFSPPLQGHLNPFIALALEIQRRGHTVTFFAIPDVGEKIRRNGLGFYPLAVQTYPIGSLRQFQDEMARQSGMAAMLYWNQTAVNMAEQIAPELPAALQKMAVDAVLVDQIDLLGVSVAEHLSLPCLTICNTLLTNWEPGIPPAFVGLDYADTNESQEMNQLVFDKIRNDFAPVFEAIQKWRANWGLKPFDTSRNFFPASTWGQISQQPAGFDFPRTELSPNFCYTAPFRTDGNTVDFPYEKLSGKPLVYASLGTLVNGHGKVFHEIATACQSLDVQLVISIGLEGDMSQFQDLPGEPIVVHFAPQQELLKHAALTITHAGLNTVLDSLSCGVPMIAIPISFDQAGTAARIKWVGVGEVLTLRRASSQAIHDTIQNVLSQPAYTKRAQQFQRQIAARPGVELAADYIEHVVYSQQPVQQDTFDKVLDPLNIL